MVISFKLLESIPTEHQEKENMMTEENDKTSSGGEMSDDGSDVADPAGLIEMMRIRAVATMYQLGGCRAKISE